MSAIISDCGRYRYRLERDVGSGPIVAIIGMNPSKADATLNDPTVRKWIGFGERLGWGRFIVGNVFAWRATDVRELEAATDPTGPDNRSHQIRMILEADMVVACWGARSKIPKRLRPSLDRTAAFLQRADKPLWCWGKTASGDPIHPLMLGYATPLVRFEQ